MSSSSLRRKKTEPSKATGKYSKASKYAKKDEKGSWEEPRAAAGDSKPVSESSKIEDQAVCMPSVPLKGVGAEAISVQVSVHDKNRDEDPHTTLMPPREEECLPETIAESRLTRLTHRLTDRSTGLEEKRTKQSEYVQKADGVLREVCKKKKADPILTIKRSWQRVAAYSLAAMFCMFPCVKLMVIPCLVYTYGWKPRHLVERRPVLLVVEACIWLNLLLQGGMEVYRVFQYYWAVESGLELRIIIGQVQLEQLAAITTLGSVVLWRILRVHIVEVRAHVYWHKVKAEKVLPPLATDVLRKLRHGFPGPWEGKDKESGETRLPPMNFSQVQQHPTRVDKMLAVCSAAVMGVGMWYLYAQLEKTSQLKFSLFPIGDSWINLDVSMAITAALTTFSWYKTMCGIFGSVRSMKANRSQLLLFSAAATICDLDELSACERDYLREELKDLITREMLEKPASKAGEVLHAHPWLASLCMRWLPEEDRSIHEHNQDILRQVEEELNEENGLETILPEALEEHLDLHQLDLLDPQNLQTWWNLREHLLVDFQDESAIMDACGVIVACLLVGFIFSAMVEWSLSGNPLSPAFVIIMTLSFFLIFAVYKVFEACIEINTILGRDLKVLADATVAAQEKLSELEKAELFEDADIAPAYKAGLSRASSMLDAMQKRLVTDDERQQLLGFTVNANMRNGWALSLLITSLNWAYGYLRPAFTNLDVEKMQELLRNITSD